MLKLLLSALFFAAFPIQTVPEKEPTKILLVGDSMAEGLSQHLGRISKSHQVTSIYKRGSTVSFWNRSGEFKTLSKKKWDAIVIVLGTNDAMLKNPNWKQYSEFNETLLALKSPVYWVMPLPHIHGNELIFEWIEHPPGGIGKIDCQENYKLSEDKIHLTSSGYKQWAECILSSIPK